MRKLFLIVAMLLLMPVAWAVTNTFTITVTTTFTPLHTYFLDTGLTGHACSDSNAGTSAGAPWCTLNTGTNAHSLVCGDVIVAAAGAYSALTINMQPTGCPSSSAGIDGAGGIDAAVLLCGGNVGTCSVSASNGDGGAISAQANFWSIQGWKVTTTNNGAAFGVDCSTGGTTPRHHVSYINNYATAAEVGYNLGVCGGTASVDYVAVIGSIAQNANTHTACVSAFNIVTPRNLDTVAGTHIFLYFNYGINNPGNAGCTSDGNGIILDSPEILSYTSQVVYQNNIIFHTRQYGIHIFSQETTTVAPVVKVLQNTVYDSGNPTITGSAFVAEITQYNNKFNQITQNNIALTSAATRGAADLYAFEIANASAGSNTVAVVGGTGNENIFKGTSPACDGTSCGGGSFANSVTSFTIQSVGTNTYVDPSFNNVADLSNWYAAFSCTAFENVAQCMGYDAVTSTLTTPSVIADLTPTAGGMTGKGFQRPTMTCAANSDYPVWLKGLVYLHWTGSIIQQRAGLANVPCGM